MLKNNDLNQGFIKEEFFKVYPDIVYDHSAKKEGSDSNKFMDLFAKPIKRGNQSRKERNSYLLPKQQLNSNLKNGFLIDKKQKLDSIKESTHENNINSNNFNEDNIQSFTNSLRNSKLDFNENYYLVHKGIQLQKDKKKRSHSIKRALENFFYKSTFIEKLTQNLIKINNLSNNDNQDINNNEIAKIKTKIFNIVTRLAEKVVIKKYNTNDFIVKMNEIGDECYFLLSGKLSVLKPSEYKDIKINYNDYFIYLINLLKLNEIDLINHILKINHNFISIKSIDDLKRIVKSYCIKKIYQYLDTYHNLSYRDIETFIVSFNLSLEEDFNLTKKQILEDLNNLYEKSFNNNLNDSFDDNIEKEEKKINNDINKINTTKKDKIFREYIRDKFKLTIEDEIILMNYEFIFDPMKEKNSSTVTLYKYEVFLYLPPGSFFGDTALDSKNGKRNATIKAEEDCFILSLNFDAYNSILYQENKKLKSVDLIFICSKFFFNEISPIIFDKYYYSLFKLIEKKKDDVLFKQYTELNSIYFIKEGSAKLEFFGSLIDIHNLIKFLIDVIFEKNFIKLSTEKLTEMKEQYLNDDELLKLCSKDIIFKEKFNKKEKFEISKIDSCGCLGDLELFLTSCCINKCTITSLKCTLMEIKKKDLYKIFNEEKPVLSNYYEFVTNKIVSFIKRLYYLKNIYINQIKYKVKENFYGNEVQPNFHENAPNDNTSKYYNNQKILKKILPNIFKFSHFDPPNINDSKWIKKKVNNEKNEVIHSFSQKTINNLKQVFPNKFIKPNSAVKRLEDLSTSKTLALSQNKDQDSSQISSISNIRSSNSYIINNNILKNKSRDIITTGKYKISISKIERQSSHNKRYDPENLNIVQNQNYSSRNKKNSFSIENNNFNGNSLLNLILPPINKKNESISFVKKMKIKMKLNKFRSSSTNTSSRRDGIYSEDIEYQKNEKNDGISKFIKDFYNKKKIGGYSLIANPFHNKYNKKYCIYNKIKNKINNN